jgi:hypothetical protein
MSPQVALPPGADSRHEHCTPKVVDGGHDNMVWAAQPPAWHVPEMMQAEALWHSEPFGRFDCTHCQLLLTLLLAAGVLGGAVEAPATQVHCEHEPATFML